MNQLHVQLHLQRHHGNSMAPGGRKLHNILKSNGFFFVFFKPTFILDVTFSLLGRTTTTLEMFGCVRHREGKFQAHAASGGREREQSRESPTQSSRWSVLPCVRGWWRPLAAWWWYCGCGRPRPSPRWRPSEFWSAPAGSCQLSACSPSPGQNT